MTSILDRIASKFISYKPSICHITTKKITFTAFFPQTLNSCGRNQTLPTLATMNQINLGVPSSVTKRFKHPHKVLARAQGLKSPGNWWSILADREDRGDQARSCQIEWRAVVMSTPVSASARTCMHCTAADGAGTMVAVGIVPLAVSDQSTARTFAIDRVVCFYTRLICGPG